METQVSARAEDAIDTIFADILAADNSKVEHFQAKLDFIFEKVNRNPKLLGYKAYKLCVAQAYLFYVQGVFAQALGQLETAEKFVDGHEMQGPYARADEKITAQVREYVARANENQRIDTVKQTAIKLLLAGVGLLALGGIITGITYSLASPGGTYLVTSGLFIVGIINLCVSGYNFLKWLGLKATH